MGVFDGILRDVCLIWPRESTTLLETASPAVIQDDSMKVYVPKRCCQET